MKIINEERRYQQKVIFDKPIIVGETSEFWQDCPNVALVDPSYAYVYFEDFIACGGVGSIVSETENQAPWLATLVDGGSANAEVLKIADDQPGGVFVCTTNPAANDLNNLQLNGEMFKLASGKNLWFETKIKIVDVDKTDWFIGLAITDTTILAGTTDSIGFRCPDHTGDIDYVCEKDSTETAADTGANLSDNTWVRLGFKFDGINRVTFFVDGVPKAIVSTNIPDDEALTPSFEVRTSEASAHTMYVDYIKIVQFR